MLAPNKQTGKYREPTLQASFLCSLLVLPESAKLNTNRGQVRTIMDHSMQGSKDSYSPQVHILYPDAQPGLYPPRPPPTTNPQGGYGYQYQGYFGEAADPPYGGSWQRQPAAPSDGDGGPFYYQDDADCITFLRGCLAGLCCCCLLEQCCLCCY